MVFARSSTPAKTAVRTCRTSTSTSWADRVRGQRADLESNAVPSGENIMGGLSIWHWLIVLLVVVLIFGTKKLKNIGSDLGSAVKGFKDGVRDGTASPTDPASPTQQVGAARTIDPGTVDVEAKTTKS